MLADMMGAMGGAMGMGNGGSFAQKRPMMQQNPGMKMRPQMGGGMGGPLINRLPQRQQYNPMETRGGYGRPPVGFAPDPNYKNRLAEWMSKPVDQPQRGGGLGPRFPMGGNTGIAGGMRFPGMTPPYFPQQQQGPIGANDGPQRQTRDPNAPGYDPGFAGPMKGGGNFRDMLQQIMGQFGQPREGMAQTQGGPMNDPRWSNGTWGGQRPGIGPRIAPQMSMMPQMPQPVQPQMQQEEEQYY